MRSLAAILILVTPSVCLAQPERDQPTGQIQGVVRLDGRQLLLKPLVGKDDPVRENEVCSFDVVPDERLVVDKKTQGIRNVLVWIRKLDPQVTASPREKAIKPIRWSIKDCRLQPHVLIVPVGQPLRFASYDPTRHRPLEYPIAGQPFDVSLAPAYSLPSKADVVFEEPNPLPVPVKCSYHPWISGYRLTLNHPFATVTRTDGTFEISHVPQGNHQIVVWHELRGYLLRTFVKVGDGKTIIPEIRYRLTAEEQSELTSNQ